MYRELLKYFSTKSKVRLESEIGDDIEYYHGYIVSLTKRMACIWLITDWHYDGLQLIPLKYLTGVRCNKYDKACHKVLKNEKF